MATGPLIFAGTTHWLIGREIEKGRPPVNIWQWKFCDRERVGALCNVVRNVFFILMVVTLGLTVLLELEFRAGELNCNEEPVETGGEVVMVRGGLAGNAREKENRTRQLR